MAHETNSYAKCGAKVFRLFNYRQGIVRKKTNNRLYASSELFSWKSISNLCWNYFFPMNTVKILCFDQLIEIENKLGYRHCEIHYYENPINAYQLVSKEHYWLIVLIIFMIHYLISAAIYISNQLSKESSG